MHSPNPAHYTVEPFLPVSDLGLTLARDAQEGPAPFRDLPVNIEAEQEILGAIIARPETLALVQPILSAEHFAEPLHATLFRAVLAAVEAQQAPSLAVMRQHLGSRNLDTDVGGTTLGAYIARLVAASPSAVGLASTAG